MAERGGNVGLWLLGAAALAALMLGGGSYAMYKWEESAEGKKWAPVLAAAEQKYGLPAGLLSRQAAQESSFDPAVIYGQRASSAGALGILQLEPRYFSSVDVPAPFTDADVAAQIDQAAAEDARLYNVFGSWAMALAAYNWGEENLKDFLTNGEPAPPPETQAYVANITRDVPAAADAVLA